MSPVEALLYIGGAASYAAVLTALFWGLARLWGRHLGLPATLLVLAMSFVVFLGIHPFPNPATLDCSAPPKPGLRPFRYADAFALYWQEGRPLSAWLSSKSIMAPIMNVFLFAPAGLALAWVTPRWLWAVLLGLGLTAFIETAQVTALFGLYPCPYRQFEIDDLILNLTGVVLGFALGRGLRRVFA